MTKPNFPRLCKIASKCAGGASNSAPCITALALRQWALVGSVQKSPQTCALVCVRVYIRCNELHRSRLPRTHTNTNTHTHTHTHTTGNYLAVRPVEFWKGRCIEVGGWWLCGHNDRRIIV